MMRTRTRTARWRLQATPTSGWAASATVRYLPTYGVDRNATSQATALRICPSGIRAASACPPASRNNRLAARDLGRAPTRVVDTYMRRVTWRSWTQRARAVQMPSSSADDNHDMDQWEITDRGLEAKYPRSRHGLLDPDCQRLGDCKRPPNGALAREISGSSTTLSSLGPPRMI